MSFGWDTTSRWSLLSGVYARGSKRSHQSGLLSALECVTVVDSTTHSKKTPHLHCSRAEAETERVRGTLSRTLVPVSRARSSPVPGVVAYGEWPITARTTPHVTNHRGACRLQTFRRSRSSRLGSRKEEYRHCCHIWHVFIFNYVEFTQGKLRIARDTTVNDYLCCNSVLLWNVWAHLPYRLSSLTNDRHVWFFRTRIMRRLGCKLFITSHLCYMSLMSRSVDHTSKKIECYVTKIAT